MELEPCLGRTAAAETADRLQPFEALVQEPHRSFGCGGGGRAEVEIGHDAQEHDAVGRWVLDGHRAEHADRRLDEVGCGIVGFRQAATRPPPIAAKSLENMSMKVFGCISLMSAPAAKAFSLPVTRMHPIASSASRSSTAAAISRNTPNDSALSIFGRFSVIMPTAPLLSTMMNSNVAMVHPGA
jgi:hypothetical protein